VQLKDIVKVSPRFTRSVNLERDATLETAIDGYVITDIVERVLRRVGESLAGQAGHRAWTLTGPYGSGKSAFALFLAQLLGHPDSPATRAARDLLKGNKQTSDLARVLFDGRVKGSVPRGFCPVLISGAPEPLLQSLVRACCRDIRAMFPYGRPPEALKELERFHSSLEAGGRVNPSDVVSAVAYLAATLQETERSHGIVIVIDELGKFLEFAAREPDRGDIYILQQLAEATAVFDQPALCLFTILHQSFDRYVSDLRPAIRDEWSKIQGRFEDVAFQEPPEQFISLLARAITHVPSPATRPLEQAARRLGERASDLGLAPRGMSRSRFIQAMIGCAPLHPLAALALVRLCTKFGQNQRSLFSFLVSQEAHGFSDFLSHEAADCTIPFYRLYDLYDHLSLTLGTGLSAGEGGTRWAEVHAALDRAASLPDEAQRIVKAVGLLGAIGAYGEFKATPDVLAFAFGDGTPTSKKSRDALTERSILVYRKHSQAFALWQGSDIDIDGRLREAKQKIPLISSLADKLNQIWPARPLVAKRHSFEKGTLRYFALRFADASNFISCLEPNAEADGLLVYCLPSSREESEELLRLIDSHLRGRVEVLVAIPRDTQFLRDAVRELELLRWVETSTPELLGDAVARRELGARIIAAEERVATEIRKIFSPGEIIAANTRWIHRGIPSPIGTARSLANLLSDICDSVYEHTPRLRNELINRRVLSSAAAAARRNLIDAMITRGEQERLGISGAPPEMSMYASLLGSTGIHREELTGYAFGPPLHDDGLLEVWKRIEAFFASCELERRSILDLFTELQRPPFGLKMGVIPILFCAASLAHDSEVALYEQGAFVPEPTVEIFERLLRSPERFEVRRYQVEGVRREVFRRFAELLGTASKSSTDDLVAVVRPLYKFFNNLPPYTRTTRSLSPAALAVREVLVSAREPDRLLFEDLPRACGTEPFLPTATSQETVASFFKAFHAAVSELQRAYHDLLRELRELVFRAFSSVGSHGREAIRFRAQRVAPHAVEPRLKAFIHHLIEDSAEDTPWIEALATLLAGKAPRAWTDTDRAKYEVNLAELTRSFRHMEALVFDLARLTPADDVLRIGVTDRHSKDAEAVVVIETADQNRVAEAVIALESCLEGLDMTRHSSLALAALAKVSKRFLTELETAKEAARGARGQLSEVK